MFQTLKQSIMSPSNSSFTLVCLSLRQLKYKEKFDKEMKGKRPQYDLKDSKIYQTLKDANVLASEVGAPFTCRRSDSVKHGPGTGQKDPFTDVLGGLTPVCSHR